MSEKIDYEYGVLPTQKVELDIKIVEIVLGKTRESIRKLTASGRLKRKFVKGKYIYDRKSVSKFILEFDRNDYYSVSEATQVLKDNGIWDQFKSFNKDGNPRYQCKYERYTNEFPISPKQLLQKGYLVKDKDIKPILITKQSMVDTIKKLTKRVVVNNFIPPIQTKSA